ncbi:Hypothetical predicted protein [Olea europaea subsp. europaea]|uniref:Uncharacterized protein n=1 Tax=Olea europaea subsp. europaea TaxID=158383 RepID=A0A8S0UR48_OLEEU|nr:Hypothetical predicted protein [Olea europaea subsp. europaea]
MSRPDEENSHKWGSALRTPRDGAREVDEETDTYRCVLGCILSYEEQHDVTVGESLICYGNSKNFNCSTEMEEHIRSSGENDNRVPFCSKKSVVETVSSHHVIHVVARAGVPWGRPMIPLKFEGGLGWKGSAATSALYPASFSKSFDKKPYSSNFTELTSMSLL